MKSPKSLVRAFALGLAVCVTISAANAAPVVKPDSLLAVDQNRSTIIDGVVAAWGAQLEQSGAGLSSAQLRTMLQSLRADQLLAASMAGSLSGLRSVLSNAADIQFVTPERVTAKTLGTPNEDLVYTPIVPCRILDSRNGTVAPYNAPLIGGSAIPVATNLASFAAQGGSATNCGLPASFNAIVVTLTVLNPNFDAFMAASPSNNFATLTQAVVMNFTAHQGTANTAIVPVDGTNKFYLGLPSQVTTFTIVDALGYFAVPQGGYVASVSAGTGVAVTGTTANPIVGVSSTFQLPQGCSSTQTPQSNGTGGWTCATIPAGPAGPTGPVGPAGPAGATGAAGPAGAAGATGPAGATGATGPAGAVGPAGATGANGNTVRNGTGAPLAATGVDGDFYIDTATDVIYGPKSGGVWPATGTSLTGPAGPTGAAGPAGSQGVPGATGPAGPAGAAGAAGAVGPAGPQGVPGATGATGTAGATGATGPAGPAGATGATGPAGDSGNTLLSGTGAPSNASGANGDFYIDTATNVIYGPKSGGAWPASGTSLIGATGAAGPQGVPGATGATGPAGAAGATGATGAVGPAGPQGVPGVIGATGPAGAAGATGATGAAGPAGPQGDAGVNGNTVLSGTGAPLVGNGVNGDFYIDTATDVIYGPKSGGVWPASGTSLTGPAGSTGAAGPAGAQGVPGAVGPIGPAGPAGTAGATGATGATGPAGATGATGPTGPAGATGATGATGPAGAAGANGNTLLSGTGAPSGASGVDGDFYIDTATDTIYGPKASGAWPVTGTSLVGATGATGATGPIGPIGASGDDRRHRRDGSDRPGGSDRAYRCHRFDRSCRSHRCDRPDRPSGSDWTYRCHGFDRSCRCHGCDWPDRPSGSDRTYRCHGFDRSCGCHGCDRPDRPSGSHGSYGRHGSRGCSRCHWGSRSRRSDGRDRSNRCGGYSCCVLQELDRVDYSLARKHQRYRAHLGIDDSGGKLSCHRNDFGAPQRDPRELVLHHFHWWNILLSPTPPIRTRSRR